jgi:hypothetical protein
MTISIRAADSSSSPTTIARVVFDDAFSRLGRSIT